MEISEDLIDWSKKEMRYKAETDRLAALATAKEDGEKNAARKVVRKAWKPQTEV